MTAAKLRISEDCIIAIQRGFVQYAETLGAVRSDGRGRWKMLCPLPDHADGNPSFAIFDGRDEILMAKCSCGFAGGVIQLAQRIHTSLKYSEILRHIAEVIGVEIDMVEETDEQAKARKERATLAVEDARLPLPKELPPDFDARHIAARSRLWKSPKLLAKVEEMLGIPAEVIRSLCYTTDALGWANGCLLYLYEHGCKSRLGDGSPETTRIYRDGGWITTATEGKRFVWNCGSAVYPWRWHFAARPEVKEIFITESESDAMALIASGVEELYPRKDEPASAVIACPGGAFHPAWGPLFKGKRATVAFDWDGKSDAARDKAATIISKHAQLVSILAR